MYNATAKVFCHICGSDKVTERELNFNKGFITSDSKEIFDKLSIISCKSCSIISKNLTPSWHENVAHIYKNYSIYTESKGAEKICFGADDKQKLTRSETLIKFLESSCLLQPKSHLLDIGTGNGVFLRAISEKRPDFSLFAQDLNDNYLEELLKIKGFEDLYTANIDEIDKKVDIVSMVHVLEHVPYPVKILSDIGRILANDGILLINVPDGSFNPIDLLVYDHCSHFSLASLEKLLRLSGFEIIASSRDKIKRELVIIARFSSQNYKNDHSQQSFEVDRSLTYLEKLRTRAMILNNNSSLYIFGASLAGIWLANELQQWRGCFVDEDPSKIGNFSNGHKIVSPHQVKKGTVVLIPLEKSVATSIAARLNCDEICYEFIP